MIRTRLYGLVCASLTDTQLPAISRPTMLGVGRVSAETLSGVVSQSVSRVKIFKSMHISYYGAKCRKNWRFFHIYDQNSRIIYSFSEKSKLKYSLQFETSKFIPQTSNIFEKISTDNLGCQSVIIEHSLLSVGCRVKSTAPMRALVWKYVQYTYRSNDNSSKFPKPRKHRQSTFLEARLNRLYWSVFTTNVL